MHRNRSLLAELLLRLVHLADEVDEAVAGLRDALLRPVVELELPERTRATVACVRDLELSQHVQRHIVLGDWLHHQTLIPNGPLRRPILITLFLEHMEWSVSRRNLTPVVTSQSRLRHLSMADRRTTLLYLCPCGGSIYSTHA